MISSVGATLKEQVRPECGPGPECDPGPEFSPGPESGSGPECGPGPESSPGPESGSGPECGPGLDQLCSLDQTELRATAFMRRQGANEVFRPAHPTVAVVRRWLSPWLPSCWLPGAPAPVRYKQWT